MTFKLNFQAKRYCDNRMNSIFLAFLSIAYSHSHSWHFLYVPTLCSSFTSFLLPSQRTFLRASVSRLKARYGPKWVVGFLIENEYKSWTGRGNFFAANLNHPLELYHTYVHFLPLIFPPRLDLSKWSLAFEIVSSFVFTRLLWPSMTKNIR